MCLEHVKRYTMNGHYYSMCIHLVILPIYRGVLNNNIVIYEKLLPAYGYLLVQPFIKLDSHHLFNTIEYFFPFLCLLGHYNSINCSNKT